MSWFPGRKNKKQGLSLKAKNRLFFLTKLSDELPWTPLQA
jgi:hypothetical protein